MTTIKDIEQIRACASDHTIDGGMCLFWFFALVDGQRKKSRVFVSLEAVKDESFLIEEMMIARMRKLPGGEKAKFLGFEMVCDPLKMELGSASS